MEESKSDTLSTEYKSEGNENFRKGDMRSALQMYNLALCYAQSKECLAFAYANRSAVYLELKKYDECLQNIQWARENNYPEDKIQKLNEREEKCKQLKAAHVIDPEEDPWNFLKLSHPPNPKIPFIVDCLEMKVTEKYGRGIYATRDIATGDFLSIEDSFIQNKGFEQFGNFEDLTFCLNCYKRNMMNLIPCSGNYGMYCSTKCLDKNSSGEITFVTVLKKIDEMFGGREKLIEFLESVPDITALNYSVFDFDWSNPNDPEYGINQIKCFISFRNPFDDSDKKIPFEVTGGNKLIEIFVRHVFAIITYFMKEIDGKRCWQSAFGNLINHSCIPNVKRFVVEGKVIIYAMKPIKAGEQLFESYFGQENVPSVPPGKCILREINYTEMPLKYRKFHTGALGFECDCDACKDNLSKHKFRMFNTENADSIKDRYMKNRAAFELYNATKSLKPLIAQWKHNNEFITQYHENLLSMDVHYIQVRNMKIIEPIAKAASFPFRMKETPSA